MTREKQILKTTKKTIHFTLVQERVLTTFGRKHSLWSLCEAVFSMFTLQEVAVVRKTMYLLTATAICTQDGT